MVENGGNKMTDMETMISEQRLMCMQRYMNIILDGSSPSTITYNGLAINFFYNVILISPSVRHTFQNFIKSAY